LKTAILVFSVGGLSLARRLCDARLNESTVFGPSCVVRECGGIASLLASSSPGGIIATDEPGVFGWTGPLRRFLPTIWEEFDAIVAVMALGIVVRLVGPLASDKRRDPAVVVVDEAGRFAISVLGGHGAGANELAVRVAEALGAVPVITTASDVHGLPAVDQIGRAWGWTIERTENLTRVAAAVVRREPVAVWQDAGSTRWWERFGPWPAHFVRLQSWSELAGLRPAAVLVISDRIVPADLPADRTVVYRPPTLVAGLGCRRGTPAEEIAAWVDRVFAAHALAPASLAALATVTLKADEPGLLAFAEARGLPLIAFRPEELAEQPGIERPSERVRAKIGIAAVAEPAALRAAGADRLLVPKQIGPGITVAVARRLSKGPAHQPIEAGGPKPGA
jgi:cobalt-precorrin 5A hydrolase